jgi:hypothetical protein
MSSTTIVATNTSFLGRRANSTSNRASKVSIDGITVEDDYDIISLQFTGTETPQGGQGTFYLRPSAALFIAHQILARLPALYVAADGDLMRLLRTCGAVAEHGSEHYGCQESDPSKPS